jgi:hypothetical protein
MNTKFRVNVLGALLATLLLTTGTNDSPVADAAERGDVDGGGRYGSGGRAGGRAAVDETGGLVPRSSAAVGLAVGDDLEAGIGIIRHAVEGSVDKGRLGEAGAGEK